MICGACSDKHYKFLQCYTGGNIYYTEQELRDSVKEEEEEKKEAVLEKKNSEGSVLLGKRTRSFEESCDISEKVKQFENVNDKKPIFVKENWNNNLCFCEGCQKMYKENGVVEVLEEEVTNAESWEQPTAPEAPVNLLIIAPFLMRNRYMKPLLMIFLEMDLCIIKVCKSFQS